MSNELAQEEGWQSIIDRLGQHIDIESSAAEYSALVRKRTVSSASTLLHLCFAYVLGQLSLRMLSAWAQTHGVVSCSDVALLKRLRGSADWLEAMACQLIQRSYPALHQPSIGRLLLVDGSMIGCVRDGPTARRLHVVYDLASQRPQHVEITDCHTAERLDCGKIIAGDIRIGDRGFARHGDLASVKAQGGDFIVRTGAIHLRLMDKDHPAERINLEALCTATCADHGPHAVDVLIEKGGKQRNKPAAVAARLIVAPLPADKIAAARQRAQKAGVRWQYNPSQQTLAAAGHILLVTSLPADSWPPERVLAAYRLRWQVELLFKRWKSLIGMNALRAHDPKLIRCWIAVALIVALLIDDHRPDITHDGPDSLPLGA